MSFSSRLLPTSSRLVLQASRKSCERRKYSLPSLMSRCVCFPAKPLVLFQPAMLCTMLYHSLQYYVLLAYLCGQRILRKVMYCISCRKQFAWTTSVACRVPSYESCSRKNCSVRKTDCVLRLTAYDRSKKKLVCGSDPNSLTLQ